MVHGAGVERWNGQEQPPKAEARRWDADHGGKLPEGSPPTAPQPRCEWFRWVSTSLGRQPRDRGRKPSVAPRSVGRSIPAGGLLFALPLPVRRHPLRDLGPLLRCPLPAPALRRRPARYRPRGLRLVHGPGVLPSAAPGG